MIIGIWIVFCILWMIWILATNPPQTISYVGAFILTWWLYKNGYITFLTGCGT